MTGSLSGYENAEANTGKDMESFVTVNDDGSFTITDLNLFGLPTDGGYSDLVVVETVTGYDASGNVIAEPVMSIEPYDEGQDTYALGAALLSGPPVEDEALGEEELAELEAEDVEFELW